MQTEELLSRFLNSAKELIKIAKSENRFDWYLVRKIDAKFSEIEEFFNRGPVVLWERSAKYYLDDLFILLQALSPEGYTFGLHPDDKLGCFGFWLIDEDEGD